MKKMFFRIFVFSFILLGCLNVNAQSVSVFDDLSIEKDSFWDGRKSPLGTTFQSGNAIFSNYFDTSFGGNWISGFAYSAVTDTTGSVYSGLFSAHAGTGYNSEAYGVMAFNGRVVTTGASKGKTLSGFYVTNTTIATLSMRNGDGFAKKFGGAHGDDPDWFRLNIVKWYNGVAATDTFHFFLADFRDSNNANDYILTDWTWVDLTSLGNVDSLDMSLSSTDNSNGYMNTPGFIAIDNFTSTDMGASVFRNRSSQLQVYPNPCTGSISINTNEISDEEMVVSLFDISGKIVCSQKVRSDIVRFNIGHLVAGVYVVEVIGTNSRSQVKIIKQ